MGEGDVGRIRKDEHAVVGHLDVVTVAPLPAPEPKCTGFAKADRDDGCTRDELFLIVTVCSHLVAERPVVPVDEYSIEPPVDLPLAPRKQGREHVGEG